MKTVAAQSRPRRERRGEGEPADRMGNGQFEGGTAKGDNLRAGGVGFEEGFWGVSVRSVKRQWRVVNTEKTDPQSV